MAQSTLEQQSQFPFMAYNFRVIVDGVSMGFAEVEGLQRSYEQAKYLHGYSFLEGEELRKHRIDRYQPLTLRRGTLASGATELYEWLESDDTRSMVVSLCNEAGNPVVNWNVAKAVAVKLEAQAFTADTNEIAIEVFELAAAGISLSA